MRLTIWCRTGGESATAPRHDPCLLPSRKTKLTQVLPDVILQPIVREIWFRMGRPLLGVLLDHRTHWFAGCYSGLRPFAYGSLCGYQREEGYDQICGAGLGFDLRYLFLVHGHGIEPSLKRGTKYWLMIMKVHNVQP